MGKALLGTHATPSSLRLLDEIRALRQRVADLESALAAAEAARDARADGREGVADGRDDAAAADIVDVTAPREPATT